MNEAEIIKEAEKKLDDLKLSVEATGHAIDLNFVVRVCNLDTDEVLETLDGAEEFSQGFVRYLQSKSSVVFLLRCDSGMGCKLDHAIVGWHTVCILYKGIKYVDKQLAFDSFMKELINRATIIKM